MSSRWGLSPIITDLMERGIITAVAMNGAGIIHDFELALMGHTSEEVDAEIDNGRFGMAEETGRILNDAITRGAKDGQGLGEAIGRYMNHTADQFPNRAVSILATGATTRYSGDRACRGRNRHYPHAPLGGRRRHRSHVSPGLQASDRRRRWDGRRRLPERRLGGDSARGLSKNTVIREKPRPSDRQYYDREYGLSLPLPTADQRRAAPHAKGRPGLFLDRSPRDHAAVARGGRAGGIGMSPSPSAPSLSVLLSSEWLQARWQHLNTQYFAGSLRPIEIVWSQRLTSSVGMFACREGPKTFSPLTLTHSRREIRLSLPLFEQLTARTPYAEQELLNTLAHEMIHQWQFDVLKRRPDHGLEFLRKMAQMNRTGDSRRDDVPHAGEGSDGLSEIRLAMPRLRATLSTAPKNDPAKAPSLRILSRHIAGTRLANSTDRGLSLALPDSCLSPITPVSRTDYASQSARAIDA